MTDKDKKIIEDAEREGIPIFVLTAKDMCTVQTLRKYKEICATAGCDKTHVNGIQERIVELDIWGCENPEKMKLPD